MTQQLTDIDSLCLQVRDRESQRLITEAINAYRGGALRSAIVSTWIAVTFDIISKIRELANLEEGEAITFAAALDAAINSSNTNNTREGIKQLQKLENELLDVANDKMQLFSQHEYVELNRLKEDRNKCAHPALIADNELYRPSLELVRSHITHPSSTY